MIFLPPASEGWGKVLFSVCQFTLRWGEGGTPSCPWGGGGGTSIRTGGTPIPGQYEGTSIPGQDRGDSHPRSVCGYPKLRSAQGIPLSQIRIFGDNWNVSVSEV